MHRNIKDIKPSSLSCLLLGVIFLLFVLSSPAFANSKSGYLYNLSSFNGPVTSLWALLTVDAGTGEVFSLNRQVSLVQIYSKDAMLIHSYGEGYPIAGANDLAAAEEGGLYLLQNRRSGSHLLHFDYKGELLEEIELKNLPDAYRDFDPARLEFHENRFYLLDVASLRLVITDQDGDFIRGYQIRDILLETFKDDEKYIEQLKILDFNGFCVDVSGNMYFTAPTSFSAYRMSPDGTIRGFGRSGSSPGRFGVVAGIDADSKGNIYISDKLRSVVMIFDKDFKFIREFGHRGANPENLIAPDDLVIDEQGGKLYVAQAANRGVSVFRLQ